MERPRIGDTTRVLVLTGAGISAESGLSTFRGGGGLWDGHPVDQVATPEGFEADPALVWAFYSVRRREAATAHPNPAHRALAELERRLGDRMLLVTQNVDGLHAAAGSERLVEIHGSLWRTKCSRCMAPPVEDRRTPIEPPLPECPHCGALLRPDIVWFGEMLDPGDTRRVERFMLDAGRAGLAGRTGLTSRAGLAGRTGLAGHSREPWLFIAVGTSGAVWPAAGYVEIASMRGAETWLVNLDPADNAGSFDRFVRGFAGDVLPDLLRVEPNA
jgi:NAD-dependent deacetylase